MLAIAPTDSLSRVLSPFELEAAIRKELEDVYVPDTVAAPMCGATPETFRRWRIEKRGPRYVKVGSNVRYKLSWLREFVASRIVETCDSKPPEGAQRHA